VRALFIFDLIPPLQLNQRSDQAASYVFSTAGFAINSTSLTVFSTTYSKITRRVFVQKFVDNFLPHSLLPDAKLLPTTLYLC